MEKTEVCRTIKLTDNVNAAELGVLDQFRLLISKVSNSDEAELDAKQKKSAGEMSKKAALERLFDRAVEKMQELGETQVVLGVSSEFLPYVDEVTDPIRGKGRFYDFEVYKKEYPISVRHRFTVVIKTKVSKKVI